MNRVLRSVIIAAAALTGAGCSSGTDPLLPVTVLVHNTTCDIGTCIPVHVYVFPDVAMLTPGGPWALDLGLLGTASGCFRIPPSATFTVSGPEGVENRFRWFPNERASLGVALSGQIPLRRPQTVTFVPAESRGWSVDLPSGATLEQAAACTPFEPPG